VTYRLEKVVEATGFEPATPCAQNRTHEPGPPSSHHAPDQPPSSVHACHLQHSAAGHWRIDEVRVNVGVALVHAGRFADAEREPLSAHQGLVQAAEPRPRKTQLARQRLVELYEHWGRPTETQLSQRALRHVRHVFRPYFTSW
jgi:hypothetical protein